MIVTFSQTFKKSYEKLSRKNQVKVRERITLFMQDVKHPRLRNHKLQGEYQGYWSFNVSGDIRVIYEFLDKKTVLLLKVGTHSQLYK